MRTCIVCTAELPDSPGPCPVCKSEPVYHAIAVAEFGSSTNGYSGSSASSSSADEATVLEVPVHYLTPDDELDTGIWAEEASIVTGPGLSTPTPGLPTPTPISSLPGVVVPTPVSFGSSSVTPTDHPSNSSNSQTPVSTNPSSGKESSSSAKSGNSAALEEQELVPGTLLVGRYRVVSPLGRGGMGRVYRAEDIKLGLTVAIKFLPAAMSNDPAWLARFFSEVRTAREVTHTNVCRVHDIVEIPNPDGSPVHFLTMEYVDGENLSALLKRFGRLPTQKAIEMAGQIVAGLASAHARGVLHRDLKPANIMVDGRGHAKITDFGLAVVAGEGRLKEIAGTPGYMAPELFNGGQASGRSDLFALGIVLYELFAGKQPWATKNPKERAATQPTPLRRFAPKVSGDIERVVMACLATNVADRPISAAHMLQEFPTVDFLAAAIARGETVSVDALAAAAHEEPLPLAKAWGLMGIATLGLVACLFFSTKATVLGVSPPGLSYEDLHRRTMEALKVLGWTDHPRNSTSFLAPNGTIDKYFAKNPKDIALSAQGPLQMTTRIYDAGSLLPLTFGPGNLPSLQDPPLTRPGMVLMDMDGNGHPYRVIALPPDFTKATDPEPDIMPIFGLVGLDPKLMHPVAPTTVPAIPQSRQHEFAGTAPGHPEIPIGFAVSTFGSRITFVRVYTPWNKPVRGQDTFISASWVQVALYLCFFACAIPLVRRNLAMRRGDTRGAYMLGGAICLLFVLSSLFGFSPTNGSDGSFTFLMTKIGYGLVSGATAWLGYIAIEPFARKRVPRLLISSTLMLQRKYTSFTVTRDVLLGAAVGVGVAGLEFSLTALLKPWLSSITLFPGDPMLLGGIIQWAHAMLEKAGTVLLNVGLAVPIFVILRILLKRTGIAAAVFSAALVIMHVGSLGSLSNLLVQGAWAVALAMLITQVGTVSASVFVFTCLLMESIPWTTSTSSWMAPSMFAGIAVIVGMVLWSFYYAIGDQKAFGFIKLDD